MSNELVTKKDADKMRADFLEAEAKFNEIRERVKQMKNPIVRKLAQAVMIPLALMLDYARLKIK